MEQFCSDEGCCRAASVRGLCDLHYQRRRLAQARPCAVDGCEKSGGFPGGMCQMHYVRRKKHGDPQVVKHRHDGHVDPGCSAASCGRRHYAKGLCKWHYRLAFPEKYPNPAWDDRRRARAAVRRARKKQAPVVGEITLAAVLARDAGRCGICGKKVSRRRYPHPLSASVDHMVPLAQGGAHVLANVQLAHLVCNLRKGVRGGKEQLRLL